MSPKEPLAFPHGNPPSSATTRTIWGNVGLDGTIVSGSGGFSTSKQGTGSYVIKFDEPFLDRPAYSLTPAGTLGALFLQPFQLGRNKLTFTYRNTREEPSDTGFSFIVIGI